MRSNWLHVGSFLLQVRDSIIVLPAVPNFEDFNFGTYKLGMFSGVTPDYVSKFSNEGTY